MTSANPPANLESPIVEKIKTNPSLGLDSVAMSALHEALDRVLPQALVIYRVAGQERITVGLESVFEPKSQTISPELKPSLNRVALLLKEQPKLAIQINAVTSSGGLVKTGAQAFARARQILQLWSSELDVDTSHVSLGVIEAEAGRPTPDIELIFSVR